MAKLLYLASPVDRGDRQDNIPNIEVPEIIKGTPGWITYDPRMAFSVSDNTEPDNKVAHLNKVAIAKASALIAYLPAHAKTAGVFMEIATAEAMGLPVAWVGDDEWAAHWSLGLRDIRRVEDFKEAVAYCLGMSASAEQMAHQRSDIHVQLLSRAAKLPDRPYVDDAGFDLYVSEDARIEPGKWVDVPCGIAIEPPLGYWFRIIGRSSTFRKRRLLVLEGTIDHGYRGELFVGVTNLSDLPVTVEQGERIAQMIPQHTQSLDIQEVPKVGWHPRGESGFGSSGT